MALPQGPAITDPAQGFRVPGITGFVIDEYGHHAMKFPVFTEKTLAIQVARIDVPDSHVTDLDD